MNNTHLYIYQRANNEIKYGCGISQGIAFPPQSLGVGKTPAEAKSSLFTQLTEEIQNKELELSTLRQLLEAVKIAPVVLDESVEDCYKTDLVVQSLQPSPEGDPTMGTPSNENLAQKGTGTEPEPAVVPTAEIIEVKPEEPDVSPAPPA